jgi:drug/metabolite transporter (DMT)-like permease
LNVIDLLNFFHLDLWVSVTFLAAIAQTIRCALQKKMKPVLGDLGATYIRFSYGLPFAWLWFFVYAEISGGTFPGMTTSFWIWTVVASLTQVLFTIFLIKMFSYRSFAAGTAFSKTEVIQAAIFEAIIIGVVVKFITGIAIFIGTVAVVMLSLAKSNLTKEDIKSALLSRQTVIGLASGTTLGLSTVSFGAAILALEGGDWLMAASYAGAISVTLQTVCMGLWMWFTSARSEFIASLVHWRLSLSTGFFAAVATAAWFGAFALNAVAPVRAVGQVELLITLGISILYFKEKVNLVEALSIFLLIISILMILIYG